MAATNFDLAPPARTVDGLVAVPIDIQVITAALTFDGSASSGSGDATLEFTMGPVNGNPIFDLRQTITAVWLDGASLPVANVAHHDFGGGSNAQMRILESVLAAGSTHTLRVTYQLGPPQASTAGSYQPAITWSAGPRLVFNFGFTDLGAGRYLEAWIPANLIYDQFELHLTLQILNTTVAHSVITNGSVTSLGTNHWSVAFPDRFTALSTLLEVRATDTLASLTDVTTLPVSGNTVTIEAWKLNTSSVNLTTQVNNIKTFLAANENSTGPYLHGNRFVAFLNVGGMEYEGGTTTSSGALQHETFHSWWARGLKPASQPDAWFDEAWTVYNDNGATGATPFNFTNPAVELCSRNPWVRITAGGSYGAGNTFWEGVASEIGVATLNSLMNDFYDERKQRPETTPHLEEFLVAHSGREQLVDAFHRFVYGFSNPSPAPDLWIRDDPAHAGTDAWAGPFWDSPDLWIRNSDDGGTIHQPPEFGQDNWFYARVRNQSPTATARHFLVSFNVKTYAGLEFQYPADFLPCIAAASGFDLGPGASTIVKARWPSAQVPPEGTHACWLAAVITRFDHPVAGRHVWEHNNLAQKNLTIVDLEAGDWMILPIVLKNLKMRLTLFEIEIVTPPPWPKPKASLIHSSAQVFREAQASQLKVTPFELSPFKTGDGVKTDCGAVALKKFPTADGVLTSRTFQTRAARHFEKAYRVPFESARASRIPISLLPGQQLVFGLQLQVPKELKSGTVIRTHLVQRDPGGKQILGGIAIEIRVR